jgi:hypothetical protein
VKGAPYRARRNTDVSDTPPGVGKVCLRPSNTPKEMPCYLPERLAAHAIPRLACMRSIGEGLQGGRRSFPAKPL